MRLPLTILGFSLFACPLFAQTGTYTTFGSGCPDSTGWVVPRKAVTAWGNSANAWTLGTINQRWQQEIDASELPKTGKPFFSIAWREDNANRTNPANVLTLKIMLGMTKYSSTTLTNNFGTNASGKQTVVFNGKMYLPAVPGGNQNLKKFHYVAKFSKPFIYVPIKNQNLLIEIINSSTKIVRRYTDVFSGTGTPGSRVYANGSQTATTGALGRAHMVVLAFGSSTKTAPVLSATGVPAIAKTFSVDLSGANGNTAAGLILGASKTSWGAIKLPLSLSGAGAPGCSLLVSFDTLGTLPVLSGSGSVKFSLPNDPLLVGAQFHNQFFVLDKSANTLGLSWTNGGTGKIGK